MSHSPIQFTHMNNADNHTPVWLFGIRYNSIEDMAFIRDFESILWFSYRKNFPKMGSTEITSDAGWGCMLRCAQMLMGQALQRHIFGRRWRVPDSLSDRIDCTQYCNILRWFIDEPAKECFYSIHQIVELGIKYGKAPGEWYGPGTAARVLREIVSLHNQELNINLNFFVTDSEVIYLNQIDEMTVSNEQLEEKKNEENLKISDNYDPLLNVPPNIETFEQSKKWNSSLVVIIPLRLGINRIDEAYYDGLLKILEFPQSIGILGGRPNHAMYFVGYQEQNFLALDPHTVQAAPLLDDSFPTTSFLNSVHNNKPIEMRLTGIDPSIALGFYFRDKDDFDNFCQKVSLAKQALNLFPISIEQEAPTFDCDLAVTSMLNDISCDKNQTNSFPPFEGFDDEYVVL